MVEVAGRKIEVDYRLLRCFAAIDACLGFKWGKQLGKVADVFGRTQKKRATGFRL
jgi:hypothetical protein